MTETLEPAGRRTLPLAAGHTGGRSAMTCIYRCGNACAHPAPNDSDNEYFGDVVAQQVSRRGLLKASAAGVIVAGVGLGVASPAAAAPAPAVPARGTRPRPAAGSALTFPTVPPNTLDTVVVPNGYDHSVLIRWGEPIVAGAPEFDWENQSAAAQAKQFGYNNDFLAVFPLDDDRALLVANHEYTNEELMFPGYTGGATATEEQVRIAIAAHGISVVEIERVGRGGQWEVARLRRARCNRRTTGATPMLLTGPAAGAALLRTAADPSGTLVLGSLNNCAGGVTPWGTYLSGEENFNQYFVGGNGAPEADKPALKRYGIPTDARLPSFGYRGWERFDPRFDLTKNPREINRFGWVVEVDPYDPSFVPRKRTMLGRMKHEGAEILVTKDGRIAAYMGDDERFDYMYKFVSAKKLRRGRSAAARRHNLTLLDSGTLYVAKVTGDSPASEIDGSGKLPSDGAFDGTGTWIPLADHRRSYVPGFTVEQVLVHTRLAADAVGPTKMDRPEEIEPNPKTGYVYVALTNNSRRTVAQVDEANPRPSNKYGQIMEIREARNDAGATRFAWSLPVVCGDPADPTTYFAGYDKTKVSPISSPDNVAFDGSGANLWIATDGNALQVDPKNPESWTYNDGLFAMPLEGAERGRLRQFLTVPRGAETCGPLITPDQRTLFIAVQHPGEVDGASYEEPVSTWPDGDRARPAVITVWRIAEGSARIGA